MYGSLSTKANIAASATDDATLGLTAVAGKRILVQGVAVLAGSTATNVTFNSKPAGAGTALSSTFQCGANGGFTLPYAEQGWFITNSGEGLTVTTGTGSTVGVMVIYRYI